MKNFFKGLNIQAYCAPHLSAWVAGERGEGVEPPTNFSKREWDLTGPQFLLGDLWERGVTYFRVGRGLGGRGLKVTIAR